MEEKIKKEILAFKALKKGNYLEAENLFREIVCFLDIVYLLCKIARKIFFKRLRVDRR